MSKESYYFSHDANARNDEKILMLRADYGWEGYGLYWALIEMMFESTDTCLSLDRVKGIAISNNVDITLLQSVINTCLTQELFVSDNEKFWSESLVRRKEKYLDIKRKKSEAGKKGMAKRWANQQNDNTVITDDNTVITEYNKGKEMKLNKLNKEEPVRDLFNHYLSKNIIKHQKITGAIRTAINARLRDYSFDELKKAIDNYSIVHSSDEYWFTHKYPLADFMRDKDIRKFVDEADPLNNFLKDKNTKRKGELSLDEFNLDD